MFVGSYTRTLDEKWRLPVPPGLIKGAKKGEEREQFLFCRDGDHLVLFTEETFEQLTAQVLGKNGLKNPELRRGLFGSTFAKKQDKSRRVQIPEELRGKSGLATKSEVRVIGTGFYAELWPVEDAPTDEEISISDLMRTLGDSLGE